MACNILNRRPAGDCFRLDIFTDLIHFNFTLLNPSLSTEEIRYAAVAAAVPVTLLILASLLYSISVKKKPIVDAATATASDDEEISWKSANDVFQEEIDELMLQSDAKYAEELQLQEAILASQIPNINRSSLSSLLKMQILCKICFEKHDSWQMFSNSTCTHSFCYNCTTKYAATSMQLKHKTITCPEVNCNSTLDLNTLRLIIPDETVIKWDEFLCESMIPESHKLYCPFTDCSVLLINDGGISNGVTKIKCPICRRSFCAVCRVPWHSEFSCKEFGKLKGGKDDEIVVALVKKKKWRKCPNCRFFVEKTEGCVHITCRCKYEFCYTCGAEWSDGHYGCSRQRS